MPGGIKRKYASTALIVCVCGWGAAGLSPALALGVENIVNARAKSVVKNTVKVTMKNDATGTKMVGAVKVKR